MEASSFRDVSDAAKRSPRRPGTITGVGVTTNESIGEGWPGLKPIRPRPFLSIIRRCQ